MCSNLNAGKTTLQCNMCYKYLSEKEYITADDLAKNNLKYGLVVENETLYDLKTGSNNKWYHFKNRLVNHLKTIDNQLPHIKLLTTKKIGSKPQSQIVTETCIKTAVDVVKSKGAARHYESRLTFLKASK